MKLLDHKTHVTLGVLAIALVVSGSLASAATLAIKSNAPFPFNRPPFWDAGSDTQMGMLGPASVTATSAQLPWRGQFTHNMATYSSTQLFGELAQPPGTKGDLFACLAVQTRRSTSPSGWTRPCATPSSISLV